MLRNLWMKEVLEDLKAYSKLNELHDLYSVFVAASDLLSEIDLSNSLRTESVMEEDRSIIRMADYKRVRRQQY